MMEDKIQILKVLVGSQAHGLADENSDYDYRAVYVVPTSQLLSLGYKYEATQWIEGKEDNTSWEIGHFLQLATRCNPTILEVFKAPVIEANEYGLALTELFPYIWNPQDAFNAFVGYGLNQRKKFLDNKDNRRDKYAVAYIRTLYNLIELLATKNFHVEITKCLFRDTLLKYKKGNYNIGEVINHAEDLIKDAEINLIECEQFSNLQKVNEFLLNIRKRYW
jgi:predicted nucleotidyltransferase